MATAIQTTAGSGRNAITEEKIKTSLLPLHRRASNVESVLYNDEAAGKLAIELTPVRFCPCLGKSN
jgi:hypothetical protein